LSRDVNDEEQQTPSVAVPPPKKLGRTFWLLNVIEMFERLAYFSLRVMAPVYIADADKKTNPGGLHLTGDHKGVIYAWWAALQSGLPIFTGGIADRYGYKNLLGLSFILNIIGYVMMAFMHSYQGMFYGIVVLAIGTAFFKPAVQGSLAQNLDKSNASLGWGLFYWVVNIGSLIAHYIAGPLAGQKDSAGWTRLFLVGAFATGANLLMLLTFRDVESGADKSENLLAVFKRTLVNILDARLIAWLLIMSCFWAMMYQLWDLQPNFIRDWVDRSSIAQHAPSFWVKPDSLGRPAVPQEVMISLNSALIIVLVVPLSWIVRRLRTLTSMFWGMIMATAGLLVAGLTMNGWMVLLGIAGFSLGEMLTGPKKQEYLGLIAPPGKKGLYLGYVNIPVGLGVSLGSWIAGDLLTRWSDRSILALKYLVEKTKAFSGAQWNGDVRTLETITGIKRTDALQRLQEVLNVDGIEATRILWETYSPQKIWYPFAAVGIAAAIALYVFGQMAKRWNDMNA
jgi:dipeptide/tripeptide permease